MDIAIVTGAETALGLSLIQRLVRQGYRVHGIGNNFSKVTYADPQFKVHPVDLTHLDDLTGVMKSILEEEKSLDLLIHAIDVTPGAAFESLSVGNLEAILKIGFLGPVMLTRLALPNLLRFRGQLINVIPTNKSGCQPSAVNALIEGGLREMNRALFDRARDAGLRVTNLVLHQNTEPDALSVQNSAQTHIDHDDVARVLENLIDPNFTNVPAELVLHPRCSAHSERALPEINKSIDPYKAVVLPPQAYCPPEESKIPTQQEEIVHRTIPYTDDEMEDKISAAIEDYDAHPERYEKVKPSRKKQSGKTLDTPNDTAPNKRSRGRRRGGRNRSRASKLAVPPESSSDPRVKSEVSNKKPASKILDRPESSNSVSKKSGDRNAAKKVAKKTPAKKVSKKPAKKAVKKAARKTPAKKIVKKIPTKKAVKKVAKKKG